MGTAPAPNHLAAAPRDGMTPMMAQYHDIKSAAGDALLFYRMGDFYELFFDDAVTAAAHLDITLTRRGKKAGEDVPMCGVPFHAVDTYLARLIRKGFSVAICEQTEDPAAAKKARGSKAVVTREIVRVVTPGTLTEDSLLDARSHNHLAAVTHRGGAAAIVAVDVSTGDVWVVPAPTAQIADRISALNPSEVLVAEEDEVTQRALSAHEGAVINAVHKSYFSAQRAAAFIADAYRVQTMDGIGTLAPLEEAAFAAILRYLELTQVNTPLSLKPPRRQDEGAFMAIDAATRRSLELTETQKGERRGSLLSVIDRAKTASGGRLLATWLSAPLTNVQAIAARLDAVEAGVHDRGRREAVRSILGEVPDLARALSRLSVDRGGPRDLLAVQNALEAGAALANLIDAQGADISVPRLFQQAATALLGAEADGFLTLAAELGAALAEDLPFLARDGGFIAEGYCNELDTVRRLKSDARHVIAGLEQRYRDETGIKSLKIKHSKVLGYTVEVTAANAVRMNESPHAELFRHRQTLANAVRYTTPELADLDTRIIKAAEEAIALELGMFARLRDQVLAVFAPLSRCADALAELDVLFGFADLADTGGWVRPDVTAGGDFTIVAGRHPVVENALKAEGHGTGFVPNDCQLTMGDQPALHLVTGPNMAGKSTFLRQNAVLAILAQCGSFVPAQQARLGVIDRLFSRVGAADDLARGRSTFMVEMVETAAILNQATPKSLVVLDEVGRGTATFDGLSIAWAAVEHLHDNVGCRGLFATHYHELTALSETLPRLRNVSLAVKEWRGEVVFLHEIKDGPADRSYGLAVAKLAGVPPSVVARAKSVLRDLENSREGKAQIDPLPLFQSASDAAPPPEAVPHKVVSALLDTDPDTLSPREALELVYALKQQAEE